MVYAKTVIMTRITEQNTLYGEIPINMFQFTLAAHLVDAATKIFSTGMEQLILNIWVCSSDYFDTMYWSHNYQKFKHDDESVSVCASPLVDLRMPTLLSRRFSEDYNIVEDPGLNPNMVFLSQNRKLHAAKHMLRKQPGRMENLYWHLLKYHDIVVAAVGKLPSLKTIETHIQTKNMGMYGPNWVKATVKDDAVWADWNDIDVSFQHDYSKPDFELPEDEDGNGSPGWNGLLGSAEQEDNFDQRPILANVAPVTIGLRMIKAT